MPHHPNTASPSLPHHSHTQNLYLFPTPLKNTHTLTTSFPRLSETIFFDLPPSTLIMIFPLAAYNNDQSPSILHLTHDNPLPTSHTTTTETHNPHFLPHTTQTLTPTIPRQAVHDKNTTIIISIKQHHDRKWKGNCLNLTKHKLFFSNLLDVDFFLHFQMKVQ